MPYEVLDHTADTGIEATAPTFVGLVDELATGMFALVAEADPCPATDRVEVELAARTPEDLVVDLLSELLYESETRDAMLCDFSTTLLGESHIRTTAGSIPLSQIDVTGPPIKAVTYHDVLVEQRPDHWYGRVYFDV